MSDFKSRVATLFDRFKRASNTDPLIALPIHNDRGELVAFLKPIHHDYPLTDPELPDLLGQWRQANPTLGTGTFQVTRERTVKWLETHILGRADRLLFLVVLPDGRKIGHIGFSNFNFENETAEIDSVVRGVKAGPPGLMTHALSALVRWGLKEIKLKRVRLSVFKDNEAVIKFYEKSGFKNAEVISLRYVDLGDEKKLEPVPNGDTGPIDRQLLYMDFDLTSIKENTWTS